MVERVRRFLFLLILASAGVARADWLVFIPSGEKLQFQTGRAEVGWAATTSKDTTTTVGFGLTHEIEVDWTTETIDPRGTIASFDTSYTFTDPVVNFLPGFTVGVQDALNDTAIGRRFYIATSYEVGMTGLYNSDTPMRLTIGAYTGGLNGPFVGIAIPFTHSFIGIAEHNSRDLTAGFQFKPTDDTYVEWLFRNNEVLWAAGFTMRF
jgi:hypothetical protein